MARGGAEESPHLLAHVVVLHEVAAVWLVEGAGAPRCKAGAATHSVAVVPGKVMLAVEDRHVVLVLHALRAGHARTVHGWCSTRLWARAVPRRSATQERDARTMSVSCRCRLSRCRAEEAALSRVVLAEGGHFQRTTQRNTAGLQQQLFSRS